MISAKEFYNVLSNVMPLYVAMILGYTSVKWVKLFTVDQCSGISLYVAKFAVPLLSFAFISTNNLYVMNYRFLAADTLQKIIILIALALWYRFHSIGCLEWCITIFSVAALPSIIVMGVPMLDVMYGHISDTLLVQTVVLQYLVWFPLLLFLLEYRAARLSISQQFIDHDGMKLQTSVTTRSFGEKCPTLNRSFSAPPLMMLYKDGNELSSGTHLGSTSTTTQSREVTQGNSEVRPVKTNIILNTVAKKLLRNPNTYASVAGLTWSLISFRYKVFLPAIVNNSIKILSDGALGIAMFSLGLFMASQQNFIACGKAAAALASVMKFIIGPAVMAIVSLVIGLRGTLLDIAIMQASLPLGIVTFVFAKQYDVHPGIQSTGVSFGMLIALPITLVYYIFLGL